MTTKNNVQDVENNKDPSQHDEFNSSKHQNSSRFRYIIKWLIIILIIAILIAIIVPIILLTSNNNNSSDNTLPPQIDYTHPESQNQVQNFKTSLYGQPPAQPVEYAVSEPPNNNSVDSIVFFIHGLGGRIDENIASILGPSFPNTRWVFPQAPNHPIYMAQNDSYPSWYDIRSYKELNSHYEFPPYKISENGTITQLSQQESNAIDQEFTNSSSQLSKRSSISTPSDDQVWNKSIPYWEDDQGLIESARALNQVIDKFVGDAPGLVPHNRTILMGFSQGAVMSQIVGLTSPQPLAGIGVLSGYIPMRQHPERLQSLQVPMLVCHGTKDPILHLSLAEYSLTMYKYILGYTNIVFQTIPEMPHMYGTQQEWEAVENWMNSIL